MHGTQRPFLKLPVPERPWKMPRKTHQPSVPPGSEERTAFGVKEPPVCCGSRCSPPLLHTLSGASISLPINRGHETTYRVGLHVQESLCESTWQKPGTHWKPLGMSHRKHHCGFSGRPVILLFQGAENMPQGQWAGLGVTTSVRKCFHLGDTSYFHRTVITSLETAKGPTFF